MRWRIEKPKESIVCDDFRDHADRLEMSGEQVSAVISYAAPGGILSIRRQFAFPTFRTHPDNTHASYQPEDSAPALALGEERLSRVRFDGTLQLFCETDTLSVTHLLYPSATLPIFYEELILRSRAAGELSFPVENRRFDNHLCCAGRVIAERICEQTAIVLAPGEEKTLRFAYLARYADGDIPAESEPLLFRRARVRELMSECDLSTGDDLVDTAFAFAKLRAGESLFRTAGGLIHCPGGLSYYAAVWCNDQCEYAAPWFAFTGDRGAMDAAETSFRWYERYMDDEYHPIPSSIISEGRDFWNGAGDRGDASMYLYGLCRYLLTAGKLPDAGQERALRWCAEYIDRQITPEGIVASDTDELENRISSGINLNTSALTYGGWGAYALLLRRMGREAEAESFERRRETLAAAMDAYFGGTLSGYETYHYHKGCNVIRAWNCLPVYMGIADRAEGTLAAIDTLLWKDGSCRSTEGEQTLWDRSALYYIAALFRAGKADLGWARLREYAENRLLGEHVPYPVEAYPEGNGRHLSAESALFCRIITDGLFGIEAGESAVPCLTPHLPSAIPSATLRRVFFGGEYRDITI